MSKLSALMSAAARLVGNMVYNSGLAVIGSTASAFTTTVIIQYAIDGIIRNLAAQTNTALAALVASDLPSSQAAWLQPAGLAAFYTQPANTTVYYVIGVNAAGTVKVVQGLYSGQQIQYPGGLSVVGDGSVPDVPDGFVAFAVLKVASGGSAFIPGTTALTGIGTFLNVSVLPLADRP